jgi:hypothetical protein
MVDLTSAGMDERAHELYPPTPVGELQRKGAMIGRRRRAAIALPAAIAVSVGAVAVATLAGRPTRTVVGVGTGATSSPPAESTTSPYVWLSASQVPLSGATVAAVVVNPTGQSVVYGVSGTFERWNGTVWVSGGYWDTTIAGLVGFGSITSRQPVAVSVGLSASAHGVGTVEYFSVPPLPQGWYRVAHTGAGDARVASGILHVTATAPPPTPISDPAPPTLRATPALLPLSGGAVRLQRVVSPGSNPAPLFPQLIQRVAFERWTGHVWDPVAILPAEPTPAAPATAISEVTVTVPSEPVGAYRVVANETSGPPVATAIWIKGTAP